MKECALALLQAVRLEHKVQMKKTKTLLQAVCLKHKVQILAFLKKCIAGLGVVKLPGH